MTDVNLFEAMTDLSRRGAGRGTQDPGFEIPTKDGESILIFGDLHFSAIYKGTHKNYRESCLRVMSEIQSKVLRAKENGGVSAVLFLGDLFGVKERNVKDTSFLVRIVSFFQHLNSLCDNHVYTVRGNHDFGDCPDFYLFEQLDLLKNPDYIDFMSDEENHLRVHFMNYGDESRKLDLVDPEIGNIVLAHNDFHVEGKTAWYGNENVIETKTLTNLIGASMLISGHIHTPLKELVTFEIGDGGSDGSRVDLFYPGSPTRDSERIDDVYYLELKYDEGDYDLQAHEFGLWPVEEEFYVTDEVPDESKVENNERKDNLRSYLEEINKYQVFVGSPDDQILNMPYASDAAKKKALEYVIAARG